MLVIGIVVSLHDIAKMTDLKQIPNTLDLVAAPVLREREVRKMTSAVVLPIGLFASNAEFPLELVVAYFPVRWKRQEVCKHAFRRDRGESKSQVNA